MNINIAIQKEMADAFKSHIRFAARLLATLIVLGSTISSAHAQLCDAELVNALKTRIHDYDRLVESRSLSSHYCTSSESDSSLGLSAVVYGIPVNGSTTQKDIQNACSTRNEQYLLDHHKEFEA